MIYLLVGQKALHCLHIYGIQRNAHIANRHDDRSVSMVCNSTVLYIIILDY